MSGLLGITWGDGSEWVSMAPLYTATLAVPRELVPIDRCRGPFLRISVLLRFVVMVEVRNGRQGPCVEAEDGKAYVELTGLNA